MSYPQSRVAGRRDDRDFSYSPITHWEVSEMSGYDVEPAELFAAQTRVAEAAADGRTELARLRASAQDLLGHGWRGGAASAFDIGWQDWVAGAELVLHALDEMATALGRAGGEYEQNELATKAGFQRMAS